jgi:hypothetical protein
MPIKRPDEYEHTNPNLPIAKSKNLSGAFFDVDSINQRNAVPIKKRSKLIDVKNIGLFRYIGEDYRNINWNKVSNWEKLSAPIKIEVDNSLYITEDNKISVNLNNFKDTFIYDGTTNVLTTSFDVVDFGNSLYNNAPLTSDYYIFTSPRTIDFDFPMEIGDKIIFEYSKYVVTPE